jgi:hypothetical protein
VLFWGLCVLLIAVLVGFGLHRADANDPRIAFSGGAGESMLTQRPYGTFYLGSICLSHAGEATILSITPVTSHGRAEFTDFSTFPFDQLGGRPGSDIKRLRTLPQFHGLRTVTAKCRKARFNHTQLAVEIHNPSTGNAFARGMKITYESSGKRRSIVADFDIGLCRTESGCP